MKRTAKELNTAPGYKKSQGNPSPGAGEGGGGGGDQIATAAQLAKAVGLSLFMLQVLGDMYDARTGKFSASPQLINFVPNLALPSFGQAALDRYRATATKQKKLSNDDVLHELLKQEEKQLQEAVVQLAGAADQRDKMPARERDMQMVARLLSYARTEGNYYCYVYYTGPEEGDAALHQAQAENWTLVPKSLLSHFHRRIRHLGEYQHHASNEQRALSDTNEQAPAYDPRFIVMRWKKQNAAHLPLIVQHIALLRRAEEPVIAMLRTHHENLQLEEEVFATPAPPQKRFCVERDRAEQAARGFVLHDHPRLGRISMAEFPDLSRWPMSRDIHFSMDDLVYLARRSASGDRWDPLVLARALLIALNPEAHIKRTASVVCDAHLQILERDDVIPVVEHLLSSYEATRAIKDATLEYVVALMAVDLVSREDLPPHLKAKMELPGPHDFVMLEQ